MKVFKCLWQTFKPSCGIMKSVYMVNLERGKQPMLAMKKQQEKSLKEEPVLVDPEDGLFQGFEKARASMTGREWARKIMELSPPSSRTTAPKGTKAHSS